MITLGFRSVLENMKSKYPIIYYLGWALWFLSVGLIMLWFFDDQIVTGINRWIKPLKFSISIAMFLWTVGWYLLNYEKTKLLRFIAWGVSMSMLIEIVAIVLQAARGVGSHFNTDTVFDAIVFSAMGNAIAFNSILLLILGFFIAFRKPLLNHEYQIAMVLGVFVILIGSYMGTQIIANMGHSVGVAEDAKGIPFLNWKLTGGDLRVAHFFGIHGLQLFPLLAFMMIGKIRLLFVNGILIVTTIVYSGIIFWLYIQASNGIPMI